VNQEIYKLRAIIIQNRNEKEQLNSNVKAMNLRAEKLELETKLINEKIGIETSNNENVR